MDIKVSLKEKKYFSCEKTSNEISNSLMKKNNNNSIKEKQIEIPEKKNIGNNSTAETEAVAEIEVSKIKEKEENFKIEIINQMEFPSEINNENFTEEFVNSSRFHNNVMKILEEKSNEISKMISTQKFNLENMINSQLQSKSKINF